MGKGLHRIPTWTPGCTSEDKSLDCRTRFLLQAPPAASAVFCASAGPWWTSSGHFPKGFI